MRHCDERVCDGEVGKRKARQRVCEGERQGWRLTGEETGDVPETGEGEGKGQHALIAQEGQRGAGFGTAAWSLCRH